MFLTSEKSFFSLLQRTVLCCGFIHVMNPQVHSTSIAADYKEELMKNYFPEIQYSILYVYMIVHVLWKKFYKAITASWRWPRRFYGVLEAWSCIPMDFYGRLMAVWLRAHDVQRFSPCTHCVLKALTMLTECIRNSCDTVTSERTPRGLRASSIDLSLRLYCNYMRYFSART